MEPQNRGTLCERCSGLDVSELLTSKKMRIERHRVVLRKLDSRIRSLCPMCLLLASAASIQNENPEYNKYVLVARRHRLSLAGPNKIVIAVFESKSSDIQWTEEEVDDWGSRNGFITLATSASTFGRTGLLQARSINPNCVNLGLIREWINVCVKEHNNGCGKLSASNSTPAYLRLMDCEQRRVIRPLSCPPYAALSYVWGQNIGSYNSVPEGQRLTGSLPQTVDDACKVSIELGLRYIWIDKYCINQEDEVERSQQIKQMDLVYQNAFITIIAAAGSDPHHGLPGVSKTPRSPQVSAWLGEHQLVSILSDPEYYVKKSTWMERAWTFQEGHFSRRSLVFTDQQVYYECLMGHACETVEDFIHSQAYKFISTPDDSGGDIEDLLTQYCGRKLSYQKDAVSAMEGIFHNLSRKGIILGQYYGIPIDTKPSGHSKTEHFLARLRWCNFKPCTRRSYFPSWSWAGWNDLVSPVFNKSGVESHLESRHEPKVWIEKLDGSLQTFESFPNFDTYTVELSLLIHIEAWTFALDSLQYMPKSKSEMELLEARAGSCYSGYVAVFEDSETCVQVPTFSLYSNYDENIGQQPFAPDFDQTELLGVILGRIGYLDRDADQPDDNDFILIVQPRDSYYERVGHMEFCKWLVKVNPEPSKRTPLDPYYSVPWEICLRRKQRKIIRLG